MASQSVKQIIAAAVGGVYAVIYGLWTLMATGGGHGNFIWLQLFLTIHLCGLYFVGMSVLMVTLYDRSALTAFGILSLLNVLASIALIVAWLLGWWGTTQFDRQHPLSVSALMFCGFLHFLPSAIFLFKFFTVRRYGADPPGDGGSYVRLDL